MSRVPAARYLCIAIALTASCRGGETPPPTAGAPESAPPPPLHLAFPDRNVVLTARFETFPAVLEGPVGSVVHLIVDGVDARTDTLETTTATVQIPIQGEDHRVAVVADRGDGRFEALGGFRIRVVSDDAAAEMLQQQGAEPAGATSGETGEGAVDLGMVDLGFFGLYLDDQPPYIFLTPEAMCLTDVDVHHPINQDDDEPVVPELLDYAHGAYTLRNDDADWHIGGNVARDSLPVAAVATDATQAPNPRENDLVRVDAHNLLGLPNTYLFAFPLEAEANRNLGTPVRAKGGAQAAAELAWWTNATKGGAAPGLPRVIPAGTTTAWLEGLLGGRYRLVMGVVPAGTRPGAVRYDPRRNVTVPMLGCMRQATVTVVVVDIFQGQNPRRLTAFDVYWGGRPYFEAELWPGGGRYEWAVPYKLGKGAPHTVPGQAVTGRVAHMHRDVTEGEPSAGADRPGHQVTAQGVAPAGNKSRIHGGIHVDRASRANAHGRAEPAVDVDPRDRYPQRITVAYTVDGERLVRPEPLERILPRLAEVPHDTLVEGDTRGVTSLIRYHIADQFGRLIRAPAVTSYIELYGSGLKAWEALGTDAHTQEGGRQHDVLVLTTVGQGLRPLPLGTAQRSQAAVSADRMTAAAFQDHLHFQGRTNQNQRMLDWQAWTGVTGNQAVAARRQEALDRVRDYRQASGHQTATDQLLAQDAARTVNNPVFSIPQDVILQLRSGDDRDDLMVLEGDTLSVFAPYFFETFPTAQRPQPFHFHLRYAHGTVRSELVDVNRRRTPP